MSFLAAALPAVGGIVGGLLGGKSSAPQINYTPSGFNAGGLNATFQNNGYTVTPSSDRSALVGNIASTFGQQSNALSGLAGQIAPGYSALRQAQLSQINLNRNAAINNLSQNLQNRRVMGSSFAQDAINRTAAQYNQDQANTIAQTYLQELSAQNNLINQQYAAANNSFQTSLNEMNLEAGVASDLTSKASSSMASLAGLQSQLNAQAAQGGGLFGGMMGYQLGQGLGGLSGGLSGLFGGGASGAGAGLSAAASLL